MLLVPVRSWTLWLQWDLLYLSAVQVIEAICLQDAGDAGWCGASIERVKAWRQLRGLGTLQEAEAPNTGHNVSEHRHESFHVVSHLARLLCFRERELEGLVISV
ncbi:putative proline-rich receptor-like protein kinase PERK3 [Iris pallida]|uniref:Proline-rich receptor-like protein kinase PERK3 n=1 Tax=Iris pallida TaxID=29817 RepID=A0AAX6DJM1_IRIPA|nr:putative proline-rich receptor-like protein kinase PERK3 [Iris pallida]